jgi:hypothetical protein
MLIYASLSLSLSLYIYIYIYIYVVYDVRTLSGYTVLNDWMAVNTGLQRTWEEAIIDQYSNLSGGTEENRLNSQSVYSVSRPVLKPSASWVYVRSISPWASLLPFLSFIWSKYLLHRFCYLLHKFRRWNCLDAVQYELLRHWKIQACVTKWLRHNFMEYPKKIRDPMGYYIFIHPAGNIT